METYYANVESTEITFCRHTECLSKIRIMYKFNARYPDVFIIIIIIIIIIIYDIIDSQIQQFITLYYFRATCFDSESSSGPPLNLDIIIR
jgi:hypothetical protein